MALGKDKLFLQEIEKDYDLLEDAWRILEHIKSRLGIYKADEWMSDIYDAQEKVLDVKYKIGKEIMKKDPTFFDL